MFLIVILLAVLVVFIFFRVTCGISDSVTCLVGKTAIVTGGNSGIGYNIALLLASRGCRVILADKLNSEDSKRKIIKETGNPNVEYKFLDLASFKSVREFVKIIIASEKRLDILVNNAGIGSSNRIYTEDNLNQVMQVNYFGPFLLTHLLVDLLKSSAPSRIVFTSSTLALLNNLTLENLNYPETRTLSLGTFISVYGNSKACNNIASDIFAEKLKRFNVTSNAVQPGTVRTQIAVQTLKGSDNKFAAIIMPFFNHIFEWIAGKNAYEGAQTAFHVATSLDLEGVTGRYFQDCRLMFKPPIAYRKDFCKKIWLETEKLVDLSSSERL